MENMSAAKNRTTNTIFFFWASLPTISPVHFEQGAQLGMINGTKRPLCGAFSAQITDDKYKVTFIECLKILGKIGTKSATTDTI